ncbi:hypothetical protein M422DRAFT_780287 [Sphaerobolus stellatus SS14]|uniref:Unplaced genomic scaffold SPHSTscaffold_61, whole genome shotgun sequence n=1 Tax=Sphaerobolus stellatus (strain SS14) TaxID=990650 RepID=A0A0C9UEU3_SPHS4|nr:hypothetical protein M422DRAFT_780287 [Sphaerobolus stellatus SS14]
MHLPTVRRGSFGSISSVSSNLSAHPAIRKLSMNDFTDDSAVKFYLNRKSSKENLQQPDDEDNTSTPRISVDELDDKLGPANRASLTLDGSSVMPERFTSPSTRFSLQVFILPEDLPDGMVFDPLTEAIIPKSSLRDRSLTTSNHGASAGVSQTERRKVLNFPKNTTTAEVIELALERFGIAEGVVDGGDEVEDKLSKRVSLARVRYGLAVQGYDQGERNLQPSSKILDAFARPPVFRPVDRRSGEKRRSVDSTMLLGAAEDIRPDDPIFILRRAHGLRNTGKSKMNAPLDDYALQKRHQRESMTEPISISVSSEDGKPQQQQMSRQELIAAQRLASREKQRAILSAQTNSEKGVNILLSGNRMLQSSQHPEGGDRMRYSYVQDGETIDITDIVEEVQRGGNSQDYLEDVARNHEGLGDNLDRLLNKIKGTTGRVGSPDQKGSYISTASTLTVEEDTRRNSDDSSYSVLDNEELTPTASKPDVVQAQAQAASSSSPVRTRAATVTPSERAGSKAEAHKQSSMGSLNSDSSSNEATTPSTPATTAHARSNTPRRGPLIMKEDFGIANMMTIIEHNAAAKRPAPPPAMDTVDHMLFGAPITVEELHPRVREMYAGTLKQLDDMDRELDRALAAISRGFS